MKKLEVCKMFRRGFVVVSMLVVTFAAALLGAADVRAEQPGATQKQRWPAEKILPPEPGRKACWRRVYDAKHLATHPQQKVTELTFFLRVSGYDAGGAYVVKNPDHIFYHFAFSLKRRGNKRALTTNGDCLGSKTADCVVDCDGGGVTIDKLPSGDGLSISLRLLHDDRNLGQARRRRQGLSPRFGPGGGVQDACEETARRLGAQRLCRPKINQ